MVGLEVGYSGAALELDTGLEQGAVSGADVVRNGGDVALTLGLGITNVVDRGSARIQLVQAPVIGRVDAHRVTPGDQLRVRCARAGGPNATVP